MNTNERLTGIKSIRNVLKLFERLIVWKRRV